MQQKRHINVLINALKLDEGPHHHLGGNYILVQELIRALSRQRGLALEVLVDEFTRGPIQSAAPSVRAIVSNLNGGGVLAADRAVISAVKSRRPDIYHRPTGQLPFRRLPCKTVVTITDVNFRTLPTSLYKRIYKELSYRWTLRLADRITCISDFTRQQLIRELGARPERVETVYLGANELPPADRELANSIGEPYWVTFGHQAHKNVEACLAALAKRNVRNQRQVKLLVVGRSSHIENVLRPLVTRLGLARSVEFVGVVGAASLRGLYEGAEGLVFLSRYEGFGLPVLEAMNVGCPVICSDVCSLPEIAGSAAIVVKSDDTEEVARAMEKVEVDHPMRAEMIDSGFHQSKKFNWQLTAERMVAVYASLFNDESLPSSAGSA